MRISDWSSDVCSSDLAVFERADVASPFADMIDRELDMRAEIADRKFIARDDIALELWRDGQAGALRREQRIVGTVGTRQRAVDSVIGDRKEIAADFGVVIAHASVERETILPVTEDELYAANPPQDPKSARK